MQRLSTRFAESGGRPIDVDGRWVRPTYEIAGLDVQSELSVKREAVKSLRPEGLRLKALDGELNIEGMTYNEVVLWSDTSPEIVTVQFKPATLGVMGVRIWNVWRDQMGVMQAWIGDAGMIVDEIAKDLMVLRCSDGFAPPDFSGLVVRISIRQVEDKTA